MVTSGAATTGVTPTAAETYSFAFLPQLNAFNPHLVYGVACPATAGVAVSTNVNFNSTVTGLLTSDTVVSVRKPLTSSTIFVTDSYCSTANTLMTAYACQQGTQTPLSSEVYLADVIRQQVLNPCMLYSTTLATSTINATTSAEVTTTVTGLVVSSSVAVNKPTLTPGLMITSARVTAANTIGVSYVNLTTTAISLPSETYTIANIQLQGPGVGGQNVTTGQFVMQHYYPAQQQSLVLSNALRTALVNMNLISGA